MLGSPPPHTGEGHSWLKFKVTVPFLVCFILLLLFSFASFVSKEVAICFVWRWKARALLSHDLNVFVVLLQYEEILKDTLKPLRFVSALFSPVGRKKKKRRLERWEKSSEASLLASLHEI